jgi:hypothetical protein
VSVGFPCGVKVVFDVRACVSPLTFVIFSTSIVFMTASMLLTIPLMSFVRFCILTAVLTRWATASMRLLKRRSGEVERKNNTHARTDIGTIAEKTSVKQTQQQPAGEFAIQQRFVVAGG